MRPIVRRLILLAFLTSAVSAFADTFSTFRLNGTTMTGGTTNGSLVVDTTTGMVVRGNLIVSVSSGVFTFPGSPDGQYQIMYGPGGTLNGVVVLFDLYTQSMIAEEVSLIFPSSLLNYGGGSLCTFEGCSPQLLGSDFYQPARQGPSSDYFVTLTATSTPEPAPWLCVLTGIVAVAGKLRRRVMAPE